MAFNDHPHAGGKPLRGFASMDPQRQRQIASLGGRAAHEKGTAHEFTAQEAREAGRKGGMARSAGRRGATVRADSAAAHEGGQQR